MNSAQAARPRGLFDGFEGYRSPTEEDYRRVLTKGLVVPDANVLLNLYRYNAQTRTDLFAVLAKIGDQLWVPHQVITEFWRNRESALRDPQVISDRTVASLDELREQSVEVLSAWAKRIALPPEQISEMRKVIENAYQAVSDDIAKRMGTETLGLAGVNTNDDTILQSLDPILCGRIGLPLEGAEYAEAVKEGERRLAAGIPPGYRDSSKKNSQLAAGDYLVWAQVLSEAQKRHCDVLLITGDVKDDWWRKEYGQIRGPRTELVQELRERVDSQLFMLRPDSLLFHAKKVLRVKVSDESVQDVERVDRSRSISQSTASGTAGRYPLEKLPEGRGGNYLNTLIEMARIAEDEPDLEQFLDGFQERFPTITLREVARRRMKVLLSLGLANITNNRVSLTSLGQRFVTERRLDLLQETFLSRIAGAAEVRELAGAMPVNELRVRLREAPPTDLSATQALLVLRWLEQLDLL